MSSVIVSEEGADQFPAASLNSAYTVFSPVPLVSVQAAVGAYATAVLKDVPVLEKRICVIGLSASLAESESVTVRLFVRPASPFITMVPAGGAVLSIVTLMVLVAVFPAASRARAESVCTPSATPVVLHDFEYGDEVSAVLILVRPSRTNCTAVTPTLSEAVAVSVTDAALLNAPFAGAVIETAGGVVSAARANNGEKSTDASNAANDRKLKRTTFFENIVWYENL